MGLFGVDRHYHLFEIADGEHGLVIDEGAGSQTVTITPGDYYAHRDATLDGEGYTSVYLAIEDALHAHASLAGAYEFQATTPTGSSLTSSGIQLVRTDGGTFTLYFGSGAFVLPKALFGMPDDYVSAESGTFVAGSLSMMGKWQTFTLFADNAANAKPRDLKDHRESSTDDDPNASFEYLWKSFTFRDVEYPRVPAMHIWNDPDSRGAHSAYWDAAGLPEGDHNNTLENLWQSAKKKDPVIIVHDEGDEDLQVATHPYEIAILRERAQRESFRELFTQERRQGETYDLRLKWSILSGTYTH